MYQFLCTSAQSPNLLARDETKQTQVHQPPSYSSANKSNPSDSVSNIDPNSGVCVPYEPVVGLVADMWPRCTQEVDGLHLQRCESVVWMFGNMCALFLLFADLAFVVA